MSNTDTNADIHNTWFEGERPWAAVIVGQDSNPEHDLPRRNFRVLETINGDLKVMIELERTNYGEVRCSEYSTNDTFIQTVPAEVWERSPMLSYAGVLAVDSARINGRSVTVVLPATNDLTAVDSDSDQVFDHLDALECTGEILQVADGSRSDCNNPVGWILDEDDNGHDCYTFAEAWTTKRGELVCTDCAGHIGDRSIDLECLTLINP